MLDSLPSGLQVYQLLGSNAGTDRYHDRYNCSCTKAARLGESKTGFVLFGTLQLDVARL